MLGIKLLFCERPILTKPILLVSTGQDVHFDVYLECSQKSLGSVEVATHRPPILFLLVEGVLVDCCLSFTHGWIDMASSYKEMLLEQWKRALGLLLSQSKDGVLPWGSLTIVADEIGVACSTISRLWGQVRRAHAESLIITPEIASQNNSCANALKYSHAEFCQSLKETPVSSQNILFHSKSTQGLIEYSATNVVATRCLLHPHIFPQVHIDR